MFPNIQASLVSMQNIDWPVMHSVHFWLMIKVDATQFRAVQILGDLNSK